MAIPDPNETAVSVRRLTRQFDRRVILDHLDLTIGKGEFVALLGRSGSGKSTLLRVLANVVSVVIADGTKLA